MSIKYSVVIPTYNRSKLLKNNLEALAIQTVSKNDYEVIVINDGSRDYTDAVAAQFQKERPEINFVYIVQENHGVSHARNQGIKRAKGEIIFFTDDDCVVPLNWIETLTDGYRRHPEIVGAGGWYKYSEEIYKKSVYAEYTIYAFSTQYSMYAEIKSNDFSTNLAGNTSNMSYRKSVLEKLEGFDEEMRIPGFDDWELKKRILDLGRPLLYIPIFVLHDRPLSLADIAVRIFRFGRGRYLFTKKHPDLLCRYYPFFSRELRFIAEYLPPWRIDFQSMTLVNFFLTRVGWEYQKLRQKFK